MVENERQARHLAGLRASACVRSSSRARLKKGILDDLFTRMGEGGIQELNVIVKGDVQLAPRRSSCHIHSSLWRER